MMTITAFKQKFNASLNALYPVTEIDSFFTILLEEYAGLRRIDLALQPDLTLTRVQETQFEIALERLRHHEPIQYILGETEFCGLSFKVNKNVLIPRPETEELVDWMVESEKNAVTDTTKILDIGTGSGCIPISLKHQLPQAEVWSFDVSSEALSVAEENARQLNLNVHFKNVDILQPQSIAEQFDVIVSNPPYVRQLEKSEMQDNVLNHEPHLALFVSDEDPLIFYRAILKFAQQHLNPKGHVYFEINEYLPEEMQHLAKTFAVKSTEFKKDIFGKTRFMRVNF